MALAIFAFVGARLYESESIELICIPIALIGLMLAAAWSNFRCPRCTKRFTQRGLHRSPFTDRCLNCGIVIGTPRDVGAGRA